MAGFRKAKCEKAALKIAVYGPAGSGKTLTSLLIAESIAVETGKRAAFVDTETGSHFYARAVKERTVHPEAFDFDVLETRSLAEVNRELGKLKASDYGVVVIDSTTHLWEAAIAAYNGPRDRGGKIPLHAWGPIKKPWKTLVEWMLNTPMHVVICGRLGAKFDTDDDGEVVAVPKFKAEGETGHEPDFLFQMQPLQTKRGETTYRLFAEKDRTGLLRGRSIVLWEPDDSTPPTAVRDRIVRPLLGLLGDKHARVSTQDETAMRDQEEFERAEQERTARSRNLREEYEARLRLAKTADEVRAIAAELTPAVKSKMVPSDLKALRAAWKSADDRVAGLPVAREEDQDQSIATDEPATDEASDVTDKDAP